MLGRDDFREHGPIDAVITPGGTKAKDHHKSGPIWNALLSTEAHLDLLGKLGKGPKRNDMKSPQISDDFWDDKPYKNQLCISCKPKKTHDDITILHIPQLQLRSEFRSDLSGSTPSFRAVRNEVVIQQGHRDRNAN